MLFLQLPLLSVLLPGGNNEDVFKEPISYHVMQITSYYNHSWVKTVGSGWLDEVQTHNWESNSGTIVYLRPWSKGNFSDKELLELELLFRMYFIGLTREVHNYDSQLQLEYPLEIQVAGGCELHSWKESTGFLWGAYQGLDFLSFHNNSWIPSPECGSKAENVCALLNQYQGIKEIVHGLISDTCPRLTLSLLEAGKADLQRKVKPEARLSSGTTPGPGRVLLICHVFGFYPKPVWVMWMRGNQEQPGTQRGGVLPNADGTWYLRVFLNVTTMEASDLSCRVRHSSLGDKDIILYWEHHSSLGVIFLAVIVLLVLLTGFMLWFRTRWGENATKIYKKNMLETRVNF
ncbi:PREDICTED: T-cell surface glycoprotein CD1a [Chrysochloris asiatica]|uniref:T-cell surface glycoprotein CD1a n=1 Tax=Chrysochloris asiatica TaxID=185453 RepID=A0A9B0TDH0_CHRAS|nr:PREDICTED: T-cell surface glycoprotein CD1a [Chrysochloris asiatica]